MAASSSECVQRIQHQEEVNENFLDVDAVVIDGHYSARRDLDSRRVSVNETCTYTRPQLRSNGPAMADSYPRICHVEAWINQELFGDVVGASEQQHQEEEELYITTLRRDVDEYIEMADFMRSAGTDSPAISNGVGEEQYYVLVPQGTDDIFSSSVDSEDQGMYYDEPQLWSFT